MSKVRRDPRCGHVAAFDALRICYIPLQVSLQLRPYSSSDTFGAGMPSSLTMLSASPTCFRVLTSLLRNLDLTSRIIVNPWEAPLMTSDC